MASRRPRKRGRRKSTGIAAFIGGLPRVLVWGWGIWLLAVVVTLAIMFAPPLESTKNTVLALFVSDSPAENANSAVAGPESDPADQPATITPGPGEAENHTNPSSTEQALLTADPHEKPVNPSPKTLTSTIAENQVSDSPATGLSDVSLDILSVNAADADEVKGDNRTKPAAPGTDATTDNSESLPTLAQGEPPRPDPQTDASSRNRIDAQVEDDITDIAIAASGDSGSESVVPQVLPDEKSISFEKPSTSVNPVSEKHQQTSRFTTQDYGKQQLAWDRFEFQGRDREGRQVHMALLVLSEEYFWRFEGLTVTGQNGKKLNLKEHLAAASMRQILENSEGVVCIGTASEEGSLSLEEYRAVKRADLLAHWIIDTQPKINSVYSLGLGQYQHNNASDPEKKPTSDNQRRIILIDIISMDVDAELADALRDGLGKLKPLLFELQRFSSFNLKNRSSLI